MRLAVARSATRSTYASIAAAVMYTSLLILAIVTGVTGLTHHANTHTAASRVSLEEAAISHRLGYLGKNASYSRVVGPAVMYIKVTGVIDSAIEDYVKSAIAEAERENVPLVIILNTPGGYLDNALNIVYAIDDSKVPVIGFVENGWALSAGTLILVCSHVAAMAPGTQIGSMQPVLYNPTTGQYQPVNESKIINPILKFLDVHAASKGRNITELHRFVLDNDNLGPQEALRYHVIDLIADNLPDLIAKLNGSVVGISSGNVKLVLDGSVEYYSPGLRVYVLHALSDPILSGLLLTLGTLIVLFTLAAGHPAMASLGALLLILGLAGSGFNPNYTALLLIVLGATLLFIEIHTPGFGIIGGTGIVMLLIGIALLPVGSRGFTVSPLYARQILLALYSIGGVLGAFTAFAVYKIIKVRKKSPVVWSIVGAVGEALDDLDPDREGFVFVEGEYWKARSASGPIKRGERVVVVGKDGPVLIVRRADEASSETQSRT